MDEENNDNDNDDSHHRRVRHWTALIVVLFILFAIFIGLDFVAKFTTENAQPETPLPRAESAQATNNESIVPADTMPTNEEQPMTIQEKKKILESLRRK